MTNRRRGEISITLDDKPYRLCLTLGALAELEESLGLENIGELADRFSGGRVKSADLVKILGAALRAGGADISDADAATMRCKGGASELTYALVELLRETFIPEFEENETGAAMTGSDASSHRGGGNQSSNPTKAGLV
nr:gene transfer agent family protein [uncultured Cohaesibacter sp.]